MCLTIGFCKLTETEIPSHEKIETYAKLVSSLFKIKFIDIFKK